MSTHKPVTGPHDDSAELANLGVRLDETLAAPGGAAPEAFLARVRVRRQRVITARIASVAVVVLAVGAAVWAVRIGRPAVGPSGPVVKGSSDHGPVVGEGQVIDSGSPLYVVGARSWEDQKTRNPSDAATPRGPRDGLGIRAGDNLDSGPVLALLRT